MGGSKMKTNIYEALIVTGAFHNVTCLVSRWPYDSVLKLQSTYEPAMWLNKKANPRSTKAKILFQKILKYPRHLIYNDPPQIMLT